MRRLPPVGTDRAPVLAAPRVASAGPLASAEAWLAALALLIALGSSLGLVYQLRREAPG